MAFPPYDSMRAGYAKLWAELVPTAAHVTELTVIANRMVAHKQAYQAVSAATWGRPDVWWVVGLLDEMEGGGGARTHLWNGDSLLDYTKDVPAGEPKSVGHPPPFTFLESAVAALHYDGLDKVAAWTPSAVGYYFERYNGPGYLNKPIISPYLASWSNKYTKGKYTSDGVYDSEAVSKQPGALTILKVLLTVDTSIFVLEPEPDPAPISSPTTKESPVATTPAPATASFHLDFNSIEKQLEGVLATINGFAWLLPPQAKGILAFAPVAEGALTPLDELATADWSHGSIAGILSKALRDMADKVEGAAPKT